VTVFGVPDERLGEEVAAAIYLKEADSIDAELLRVFLGDKIAKHKIPRYLWFLEDPLPRNASGKFLKRELQEKLKLMDAS
jgi:long-chain acyl-CoA synthetase